MHEKHFVFASQCRANKECASSAAAAAQQFLFNFRHSICNRYECVLWARTKPKSTNWSLRRWNCMTSQTIQHVFRNSKSISVLNDALRLPSVFVAVVNLHIFTYVSVETRKFFNRNRVRWTEVCEFNRFKKFYIVLSAHNEEKKTFSISSRSIEKENKILSNEFVERNIPTTLKYSQLPNCWRIFHHRIEYVLD